MTISCSEPRKPFHFFPLAGEDCKGAGGDIAFDAVGDFARNDGLASMILIQLLTDARRDGEGGWWGDEFMPFPLGSELWTLRQRPRNRETLIDADRIVRAALDPIFAQVSEQDYNVSVFFSDGSRLNVEVELTAQDGSVVERVFCERVV